MRPEKLTTAFVSSVREYLREPALIGLILVLPALFISVTFRVSPDTKLPVRTLYNGLVMAKFHPMMNVHGVVLTPITGAFIVGMSGLFIIQTAEKQDARLIHTGYKLTELVTVRLGLLAVISVLVTLDTIAVMWFDFTPEQLGIFVLATVLVTLMYGLIGIAAGTVLNRLSGMYLMLFGPMLDLGVFQNPMFFQGEPDWWMTILPGHYPMRILFDAAYTSTFDTVDSLLYSLLYLAILFLFATVIYIHNTGVAVRLADTS